MTIPARDRYKSYNPTFEIRTFLVSSGQVIDSRWGNAWKAGMTAMVMVSAHDVASLKNLPHQKFRGDEFGVKRLHIEGLEVGGNRRHEVALLKNLPHCIMHQASCA